MGLFDKIKNIASNVVDTASQSVTNSDDKSLLSKVKNAASSVYDKAANLANEGSCVIQTRVY